MKKTNNKGFSLVELIIVIAIMAVLIGVLAPQFIKYVEKSKQSKDITNLDSCVESVKVFYADKTWPDAGVTISVDGTSGCFVGNDTYNSTANAALTDSGSTNSKVTGKWTTALTAKLTSDGKVEYTGESDYYKVSSDKSKFEAK